MLEYLRRRREDEQGFTLIELMVVVLIIAILIAIAIPTFLGAQDRARDRGAQSDLRNAFTAAKTFSTDQEGFFRTNATTALDASDLGSPRGEPSLEFVDGSENATTDLIGVEVSGTPVGSEIVLTHESASGKKFGIAANQQGDTGYCQWEEADAIPADLGYADCDDDSW